MLSYENALEIMKRGSRVTMNDLKVMGGKKY
jgi:hypothetical protein